MKKAKKTTKVKEAAVEADGRAAMGAEEFFALAASKVLLTASVRTADGVRPVTLSARKLPAREIYELDAIMRAVRPLPKQGVGGKIEYDEQDPEYRAKKAEAAYRVRCLALFAALDVFEADRVRGSAAENPDLAIRLVEQKIPDNELVTALSTQVLNPESMDGLVSFI